MVQFEELMLSLQALKPEIDDLSDALGMKHMLSEIEQLGRPQGQGRGVQCAGVQV